MKRPLCLLVVFAAAVFCIGTPVSFGQEQPNLAAQGNGAAYKKPKQIYFSPRQKDPSVLQQALRQAAGGATLPLWSYNVVSPLDGKNYQGAMVGRSPFFNGHRTTPIQVYLIPVILTFADTGTVFDPTIFDSCLGDSVVNLVQNSPIFNSADYVMNGADVGSNQYLDAFQRANFWSYVSTTGNSYHTQLNVTVLPTQNLTVPAANGVTNVNPVNNCAYGEMDGGWWDPSTFGGTGPNQAQNLIAALAPQGVGPNNLPLFVFNAVSMYIGDVSQCCVLGYHGAYSNPVQTYSAEGIDSSGNFGGDVSTMSHEIGEWMDDPVITNPVPLWGHIGQQNGCQSNLEVGDPTSPNNPDSPPYNPYLVTMNGFNYTLQELTFFSWFYRQSPSIGSGGLYSDNTTFTTGAGAVCQ